MDNEAKSNRKMGGKKRVHEEEEDDMMDDSDDEQINYNETYKEWKQHNMGEDQEESKSNKSKGDDDVEMEDVMVDFDFINPTEEFFHGLKLFIGDLLDGSQYSSSELADLIINYPSLGTLITNVPSAEEAKDQRDLYGIAGLYNLSRHSKKSKCMGEIQNFVLQHAQKNLQEAEFQKLKMLFEKTNIAVLLNERVLNLPPKLVPSIHQLVLEALEWTNQQDDVENPSDYKFDYVLFMTKAYKEWKGQEKTKKKSKSGLNETILFYKYEDQILSNESVIKFIFPYTGASDLKDQVAEEMKKYNMIYLVPFEKYKSSLAKIQQVIA